MQPKFEWAVNNVKLQRAEEQLINEKKLDASVVIDEDSIKARYAKLGGLIIDPEVEEVKFVQESVRVVKKAKKVK